MILVPYLFAFLTDPAFVIDPAFMTDPAALWFHSTSTLEQALLDTQSLKSGKSETSFLLVLAFFLDPFLIK